MKFLDFSFPPVVSLSVYSIYLSISYLSICLSISQPIIYRTSVSLNGKERKGPFIQDNT